MTFEHVAESNPSKANRINEYKQRQVKEHKSVIESNEMKENFEVNIKPTKKELHNESKNIHNLKKNIENVITKHHISLEENRRNNNAGKRSIYRDFRPPSWQRLPEEVPTSEGRSEATDQ